MRTDGKTAENRTGAGDTGEWICDLGGVANLDGRVMADMQDDYNSPNEINTTAPMPPAASFFRIIVTISQGFMAISSAYPALKGEDWERGNDIVDGPFDAIWPRVGEMLIWLREHPTKTPDDWKQEVLRASNAE